jgi:hypothetical protein
MVEREKRGRREGGTVTINTHLKIPAAMTKIPPEKRTRSSSFSRRGRRALNSIYPTHFSAFRPSHQRSLVMGWGTGVGIEIR